ncbi:MAG: hypothetical protein FWF56_01685 [Firmicutes bacterium]|nr:hypothetical protein [Bacillota bacterium]
MAGHSCGISLNAYNCMKQATSLDDRENSYNVERYWLFGVTRGYNVYLVIA